MPITDLIYVITREDKKGAYLSWHQCADFNAPGTKFYSPAAAIAALEGVCIERHGGHDTPPPRPRIPLTEENYWTYRNNLNAEGIYKGPKLGWPDDDSDAEAGTDSGDSDDGDLPPPPPSPSPSPTPPPPPKRRVAQPAPSSRAPSKPSAAAHGQKGEVSIQVSCPKVVDPMRARVKSAFPSISAPITREDAPPRRTRSSSPRKPTAGSSSNVTRAGKGGATAPSSRPPSPTRGKGKAKAKARVDERLEEDGWEQLAGAAVESISDLDTGSVYDGGDDDDDGESYIVVAAEVFPEIHSSWRDARMARDRLIECGFLDAKVIYARDGAARRRVLDRAG